MWLSRQRYEELVSNEMLKELLEAETKRLASLISEGTQDCKVGPWCKDCAHVGYDEANLKDWDKPAGITFYYDLYFAPTNVAGQVIFCKKHLHEHCAEFKPKSKKENTNA